MNDWYYNMGLVGFIRVLEKYNLPYEEGERCITFDSSILEDMPEHYFSILYEEYYKPLHEKRVDSINTLIKAIENTISLKKDLKDLKNLFDNLKVIELIKKMNDQYKRNIEYKLLSEELSTIKDNISRIKKIKKIDENSILRLKSAVTSLEKLKDLLNSDYIKERFFYTNVLRVVLSNNFFGQVSFLNSSFAKRSLKEFKERFKRDYINPVLNEKNLILDENSLRCSVCGIYKANKKLNLSEEHLLSIGVSKDLVNQYWSKNFYPMCDLCKLILFFAPLGASYYWVYVPSPSKSYLDRKYLFVNGGENIENLIKLNKNLKKFSDSENPFAELMIDYILRVKRKSEWILQNIMFIEFYTEYRDVTPHLSIMNLSKSFARFFYNEYELFRKMKRNLSIKLLTELMTSSQAWNILSLYVSDYIKNSNSMHHIFYGAMAVELYENYKIYWRDVDMTEKIKRVKAKLWNLYNQGKTIRNEFIKNSQENKIKSIAYKLLNAARTNNTKLFMDTILRIYMSFDKAVPNIFLETLNSETSLQAAAYSFISGLLGENNVEQNKKESESDE